MVLSAALESLRSRVARIAERHFALACVLLAAFTVAWNGLGTIPHDEYRLTALDPFASRLGVGGETNNFYQQSPLLPLAGYYTHMTSPGAFVWLCLAIIAAGFFAFALLARARYGREAGLIAAALVLAHPAFLVMMSWVGSPDGTTFLVTACLLFARSWWAVGVLCLVGAFNHPIIVFAAPAVIALRATAGEKECGFWKLLPAAAGLALGTGAVYLFLDHYHVQVFSRLDCIGTRSLGQWAEMNLSHLPLALWSLHGAMWLAMAAAAVAAWSEDRRYFVVFAACQAAFCGITFFTEDTTRVFSLLSWATSVHCVMHSLRMLDAKGLPQDGRQCRAILAAVALFGLIGPHYYMWAGEIHASNFAGFWQFIGRLAG